MDEEIIQFIKKATLDLGRCSPMVFVNGTQGKVAIGMGSFGDTSDKRARDMLNAGVFTAYQHNVGELEKLTYVSEAWMSPFRKDFIRPSKDPNRVETVIINSLDTKTQKETMICFEMVRDPQGKLTDLKQISLPEGGSIEGILLPAFQKGYQMIRPN